MTNENRWFSYAEWGRRLNLGLGSVEEIVDALGLKTRVVSPQDLRTATGGYEPDRMALLDREAGEILLHSGIPTQDRRFALAHELAHYLGVPGEAECNAFAAGFGKPPSWL